MDRFDHTEGANDDATNTYLLPGDSSTGRLTSQYLQSAAGSQRSRRPSIRIRRLSSASSVSDTPNIQVTGDDLHSPTRAEENWPSVRRRSSSEPRPGRWSAPPEIALSRLETGESQLRMAPLTEEPSNLSPGAYHAHPVSQYLTPPPPTAGSDNRNLLRRGSMAALAGRFHRNRPVTVGADPTVHAHRDSHSPRPNEYDPRIVDFLDVVDPEVSTLSTLTNVQNSLFVPDLGRFVNRTPMYTLTRLESETSRTETTGSVYEVEPDDVPLDKDFPTNEPLRTLSTITSVLSESEFAVLPEGSSLEGWTVEDVRELNDHVRHMLHSRRSKFRRAMRGFWKYVTKPLGFLVTLYATLITLFGLAWVLFLIGWINVGGRQLYVINVIDNVLVALFAIMGDGLAPFRAIDTYHMIYIAHYHHLTWKLRKERALPKLQNKNDLPSRREQDIDVEDMSAAKQQPVEFSVLTPLQQRRLEHHQNKFAKSHTFYKPHETQTHYAFPLRFLVAIVILLDFHSIFQIALGACTWGINYHVRPFALTTVILCCSITCNISAGLLIMIGDRMTRKKDVVERLFRQQLTQEAMRKIEKRRRKEERRAAALERPVPYAGT
ncbi:hypothetical protein VTN02DRAFT_3717 [Thermoascus thermophilus]